MNRPLCVVVWRTMSGEYSWTSRTIDETPIPRAMDFKMQLRLANLVPNRNDWASIASLANSPKPSSPFGVQLRLIADHVRYNAPKRWMRVKDLLAPSEGFPAPHRSLFNDVCGLTAPRGSLIASDNGQSHGLADPNNNTIGNATASNPHLGVVAAPAIPGQ